MAWYTKYVPRKQQAPLKLETVAYKDTKAGEEPKTTLPVPQNDRFTPSQSGGEALITSTDSSPAFPTFTLPLRQTTFEQAAAEIGDASSMSSSAESGERNQEYANAQPKKRSAWDWRRALKKKKRKA